MEYKSYEPSSNIELDCKKLIKNNKLFPLIAIEGTDCSGKQTQSEMLIKRLQEVGVNATKRQYPNYESPTGYVVGACYLGKPHMGKCIFPEGTAKVDPIVAVHYYAADRYSDKYALTKELVNNVVVLDLYVESNIAYQAGLVADKKERAKIFKYITKLEYGLNKLIKPNIRILIYMPYEYANLLKKGREELPDGLEQSENRLKLAELAYLEMAKKLKFKVVNCIKAGSNLNNPVLEDIKSREEINNEIFEYVKNKLRIKA